MIGNKGRLKRSDGLISGNGVSIIAIFFNQKL